MLIFRSFKTPKKPKINASLYSIISELGIIISDSVKFIILIPSSEIIEYKEALIFGFLGVLKDLNINNCYYSVTGALKDHSSGNIFIPKI